MRPAQSIGMPNPRYPFTPNDEGNRLLERSGTALLIGLCLEQQVRSEKAMIGPFVLCQRIGHLDAAKIATMPPSKLDAVFRTSPALHRFPGMMAKRVRALCAQIAERYGGDGARVWARVRTADEVFRRLRELPGFGAEKAAAGVRLLARFGGKQLAGWKRYSSDDDMPWIFENGERVK